MTTKMTPDEYRQWWADNAPDGIEYGRCWCGCGESTPLYDKNRPNGRSVYGEPQRFLTNSHYDTYRRESPPERQAGWCGGVSYFSNEYLLEMCKGHPRANDRGYVLQHILVWERHHGRPVPSGHDVHHADDNPRNNDPGNLELMTHADHRARHSTQFWAEGWKYEPHDATGIPHGYCHCGCGQKTPISTDTCAKKQLKRGEPTRYCVGHNNRGRKLVRADR